MRKVYYGPEGIMLSHILRMYDKESLLIYARELQLRRISGLKKDELAEKIANELLEPTVMKRRVATFTVEQRGLLERAIDRPFVPSEEEMEDALALHERDYAFLNKRDELNVPVDVAAAYKKLNTSDFRQFAKKMSWLAQCLYFAENLYGVFNKEVLLKMYNARKGFHILPDELEQLCNEFPEDIAECNLKVEQGFIVADYLTYDDDYKDLLKIQEGKDFYIPSAEQVLDYFKNLYLSKEPAYEKLRDYFRMEIGMDYVDADVEAAEVWEKIQYGMDFEDIFQSLLDVCGEALNERKVEKLVGLLQNANNHTRLQIHRGHTPNEIMQRDIRKGYFAKKPVVVPGSTHAANLLKDASLQLAEMGITVDLDSNAAIVPNDGVGKKVYPNDPCPCGSGKKYKKCCGRGF